MSDSDAADGAGTDGDERVVGVVGTTADAPTAGVALELAARRGGALVAGTHALVRTRGPTLRDVLAGRAAPSEAVRADGPVARVAPGRPLAAVADASGLRRALMGVARECGGVVVDCGWASAATAVVAATDACVAVTDGTPAGAVGAVETAARSRALETAVAAVAYVDADAVPEGFSRALGAPGVAIPVDDATRVAGDARRPVGSLFPESEAVGAFDALAAALD
ncbi:MAG: hypothetical protein ABEJ80_07160 [Halarchaeum sp.]